LFYFLFFYEMWVLLLDLNYSPWIQSCEENPPGKRRLKERKEMGQEGLCSVYV